MDSVINFELLKDAYAIIDGIPENAIALGPLQTARGESLDQGTICSPAGWLAQHPKFIALGLTLSEDGSRLLLEGDAQEGASTSEIMARMFAMPVPDADRLFGDGETYSLDRGDGLSDKRLWQHEVRDYLKEHDQLDAAFEDSLDTRAPFSEPANPSEIRAV
ncbi:MAG TPA: hypothetical protein VGE12_05940 [Noviherbaspirillum sp.]